MGRFRRFLNRLLPLLAAFSAHAADKSAAAKVDKNSIAELIKCFKFDDTSWEIEDNKNGFLKATGQFNGDMYEGFHNFHQYRDGEKNESLIFMITYDCGPACSNQKIEATQIRGDCELTKKKLTEVLPIQPKSDVFVAFPRDERAVYEVHIGEGVLEKDPRYSMAVKAKFDWKDGKFVKDTKFKSLDLPMSETNVKKYFP
jgi:hypothetical protein